MHLDQHPHRRHLIGIVHTSPVLFHVRLKGRQQSLDLVRLVHGQQIPEMTRQSPVQKPRIVPFLTDRFHFRRRTVRVLKLTVHKHTPTQYTQTETECADILDFLRHVGRLFQCRLAFGKMSLPDQHTTVQHGTETGDGCQTSDSFGTLTCETSVEGTLFDKGVRRVGFGQLLAVSDHFGQVQTAETAVNGPKRFTGLKVRSCELIVDGAAFAENQFAGVFFFLLLLLLLDITVVVIVTVVAVVMFAASIIITIRSCFHIHIVVDTVVVVRFVFVHGKDIGGSDRQLQLSVDVLTFGLDTNSVRQQRRW
mmetsp:Transcript_9070/g.13216  ORF Transcript_9070/g.13216 Transcript_9070/m.13216 type:complete len:308 (+) Transcript_9070:1575-2498(+)